MGVAEAEVNESKTVIKSAGSHTVISMSVVCIAPFIEYSSCCSDVTGHILRLCGRRGGGSCATCGNCVARGGVEVGGGDVGYVVHTIMQTVIVEGSVQLLLGLGVVDCEFSGFSGYSGFPFGSNFNSGNGVGRQGSGLVQILGVSRVPQPFV